MSDPVIVGLIAAVPPCIVAFVAWRRAEAKVTKALKKEIRRLTEKLALREKP